MLPLSDELTCANMFCKLLSPVQREVLFKASLVAYLFAPHSALTLVSLFLTSCCWSKKPGAGTRPEFWVPV